MINKEFSIKTFMAEATEFVSANIEIILQSAFVIWFAVASMGIILYIAIYQYHRYSIERWSTAVKDENILAMFEEEKSIVGVTKKVELKKCRRINTPMNVGIIHTQILIPTIEEDYEELRYVLRHELIHIKRHDMYTKLIFVIAKCLHWFNPFAYALARNAYEDMELLCDDEVVKSMSKDERIKYSEALLNVARKQVLYDDAADIVFSFGLVQGKKPSNKQLDELQDFIEEMKKDK